LPTSRWCRLWVDPMPLVMSVNCKHFNRAVQKQFTGFHEKLLFADLDLFREKLADWSIKYNDIRPHRDLRLQSL